MSREMTDSGIPWIGKIPKEWELCKVKDVFFRKNEKAHQENPVVLSLARAGVKVRDISNNEGQMAESYYDYNPVEPFDLLVNPMDLYSGANCSMSLVSGVISPAYVNLRAKGGANPRYYDYYFKTQYWSMAFFAHGKGISFNNRWTLGVDTLLRYDVPSPPIIEQNKIAEFLDRKCCEIDEMLALQEKYIEELKAYKQSVIAETVTQGLNSDISKKDSGIKWIGQIPEHWDIAKLSVLFSFKGGYAFDSADFGLEGKIQVIRIGNVKNDSLLLDVAPACISEETALKAQKYKLEKGQILFTMTGTKGKRDYFYTLLLKENDFADKELYLNQRVGCLIEKNNVCAGYYNYLLKEKHILDAIFLYETGTANQGNLGIESIKSTKVQFPPKSEQQAIADYLDRKCSEIDNLISIKQQKIEELKEYKKSIIYEYVTGKREVE